MSKTPIYYRCNMNFENGMTSMHIAETIGNNHNAVKRKIRKTLNASGSLSDYWASPRIKDDGTQSGVYFDLNAYYTLIVIGDFEVDERVKLIEKWLTLESDC